MLNAPITPYTLLKMLLGYGWKNQRKCVALFLETKIIQKTQNENSDMSLNKQSSQTLKYPNTPN